VIDPSYLSSLRGKLPSAQLLTMVQLEQRCPGWWRSLLELGEDIGLNVSTTTKHVNRLEHQNLIRCYRISGGVAGSWLWWVKTSKDDKPSARQEPSWTLLNTRTGIKSKLSLSRRKEWANNHQISFDYLGEFLYGHRKTICGEWIVVSSPFQ
jgi:hypothetical protein